MYVQVLTCMIYTEVLTFTEYTLYVCTYVCNLSGITQLACQTFPVKIRGCPSAVVPPCGGLTTYIGAK